MPKLIKMAFPFWLALSAGFFVTGGCSPSGQEASGRSIIPDVDEGPAALPVDSDRFVGHKQDADYSSDDGRSHIPQ